MYKNKKSRNLISYFFHIIKSQVWIHLSSIEMISMLNHSFSAISWISSLERLYCWILNFFLSAVSIAFSYCGYWVIKVLSLLHFLLYPLFTAMMKMFFNIKENFTLSRCFAAFYPRIHPWLSSESSSLLLTKHKLFNRINIKTAVHLIDRGETHELFKRLFA